MNLSHPNHPLRVRPAAGRGDEQSLMQGAEVEAAVEAVSEGGAVSSRIFSEVERMVAAGETGLESAQHGVDPSELGQILRHSRPHDRTLVRAAGLGHCGKAG